MRNFKAVAVKAHKGRILLAFTRILALAVVLAPSLASARSLFRSSSNSLPLSPMKKAAFLNFPPLPREIQDRINGVKTPATTMTRVDASLSRDWALTNIGFFEIFTPLIQPIKSTVEPCSQGLVVAVVDTGIDYTHPELRDNVWVNRGETGPWQPPKELAALTSCRDKSCNGIDDDGNGFVDDVVGWDFVNEVPLPFDVHGHGTHISGIISSQPANGMGVVGVCPKVSIMPLKYYDNSGIGYNNLQNTVRAIQYAVKNGANIINYSGGGADPAPTEQAAIADAQKKGILFVAAAGNDGHNNDQVPYYPASYPLDNIIAVASINRDNQLLPSSNFGTKSVQVAAPGLSIVSALPNGKIGTMSGTSQATAFVTGAAALLASQWKNKSEFDYRKLKHWITDAAKPLPGNEGHRIVGGGALNISKSIALQKEEFSSKKPAAPRQEIALRPEKSSSSKAE